MTPDDLRLLLPRYGLALDAPIRLLNRSENATWAAGDGAGSVILRVHRAGYHSAAEIRSELDWLRALAGHDGFRAVQPLADRSGAYVQAIENRLVVGFAPIIGREVLASDDLRQWFGDLGEISARLHRHARHWQRPAGFTRKRWDLQTILGARPHWGDRRDAPGLDAAGARLLTRVADDLTARLTDYGTGAARFGLIHADLRLANLLVDAAGLWVIDFDDCGFGWWMYDFAAAVSFIETDPRLPELAALWCEGYRRSTPISQADEAILPVLIMLRRLLLTAWIGSRADSDTALALGGPDFTQTSVALADRYLTGGPMGVWRG